MASNSTQRAAFVLLVVLSFALLAVPALSAKDVKELRVGIKVPEQSTYTLGNAAPRRRVSRSL
jgi:hypothetical protein